jgi:Uma2 family endonuclease
MSTVTDPLTERLIAELYKIEGKAEIVDGRIVHMSPTGDRPGAAAGEIFVSLRTYAKAHGGRAFTDNVAFLANLPRRKSFCPDAAYYTGPRAGMKFLPQPPDFAAEVRSEEDYRPGAERKMANKRADYFVAGTKVVWDVDLESDDVVRVFRASSPEQPTIYRRGEMAEAEPAVPGWTMPVDELFE